MVPRLKTLCLRALQFIIIAIVRPYTVRELPAWGKVYSALVGDFRRNWFWVSAPPKTIREKSSSRVMHLDISQWPDRSTFFLGRWYDLEAQLLINELIGAGDTVVDVGANRGLFSFVVSQRVGGRGRAICFEPNPVCVRSIEQEIAENKIANVQVFNFGLGDRDANLILSIPPINSGEATFGDSAYADSFQVEAPVRRGDVALAGENPSFIKLDIEGYEFYALVGLKQTIRRCHPIIMTEVNAEHMRRCNTDPAALFDLMKHFGYDGFALGLRRHGFRRVLRLSNAQLNMSGLDILWFPRTLSQKGEAFLRRHYKADR
jgi:FkbM family methyltransferase